MFTVPITRDTEEWVESLSEAAASDGVEKSDIVNVKKGDPTLLIIHKHPHLLRLRPQRDTVSRASISFVFTGIFRPYRPETVERNRLDFSLPVDRLSGHS